ncbi:glycosyltransferase [Chloroflexales bacterium ZM16-3]|nr:glycosyltransferase [Chloroflexales bacterium ZM16-3]
MSLSSVDVLFAISDTGGGHRSAAVAIAAALDLASDQSLSWRIEDILQLTDFPGVRNAPNLYDQLSTRWLRMYDMTFQLTNGMRRVDLLSRLVFVTARRNITRLLLETRPKVVVVTHPLVHRFVCAARRIHQLPCRVVTVVTDLVSLHASWTYPGVDLAMVPTDEAYRLMQKRGMRPSKLERTGFPVHPKFADYVGDRASARAELGLDAGRFTILLTAGGVGSGRLGDLVRATEQAYPGHQLLVVTGKNRALRDDLISAGRPATSHIYGFVQNMEALMAASDIVVTKAGPGTLMEALVMRKPVIVTEAVGMQEQGNIDFVLNYDLGMFCPTAERIVGAVSDLENPQRYAATVERLTHSVPRDGSAEIARLVIGQMSLLRDGSPAQALRRRPRLRLGRLKRMLRRR